MRGLAMGLGLLALVLFTYSSALSAPSQESNMHAIKVKGEKLEVGDIVATGIKNKEGMCEFGTVTVDTQALGDGQTQWLGINIDEQCRATVNSKWIGSLEQGPADVVGPLMEGMRNVSNEVAEDAAGKVNRQNAMRPAYGTTGTKTSEQHVFMYGYGGQWDKLTHKYGKLTFTYNGQTATISSQSGTCQGSKPLPWYEWVVDGCWQGTINYGPSSSVWRQGEGDYHCDPAGVSPCNFSNPDGYYHSLYDYEAGYADGRSSCVASWDGNIAAGVGTEFLQGCS